MNSRETEEAIALIGRAAGKPWRADERAAAIAAWLAMATALRR